MSWIPNILLGFSVLAVIVGAIAALIAIFGRIVSEKEKAKALRTLQENEAKLLDALESNAQKKDELRRTLDTLRSVRGILEDPRAQALVTASSLSEMKETVSRLRAILAESNRSQESIKQIVFSINPDELRNSILYEKLRENVVLGEELGRRLSNEINVVAESVENIFLRQAPNS
jgi:polyribonucleotide nucleotidyltransferase